MRGYFFLESFCGTLFPPLGLRVLVSINLNTVSFSHPNSLHQESSPPTGCVHKAQSGCNQLCAWKGATRKQFTLCICYEKDLFHSYNHNFSYFHNILKTLREIVRKMSPLIIIYHLFLLTFMTFVVLSCSAGSAHAIGRQQCWMFEAHPSQTLCSTCLLPCCCCCCPEPPSHRRG